MKLVMETRSDEEDLSPVQGERSLLRTIRRMQWLAWGMP